MGGRFTFSDDSHGVPQVGLNFDKTLDRNITRAGLTDLYHLARIENGEKPHDARFPRVCWHRQSVLAVKEHPFFQT